MRDERFGVRIREEVIEIPTYPVGEPDKNPMFLEKRVYQGSSGKVYPYPVIDKIYDNKINKKYKAIFLENEYLEIMILPELGGRIQRALDKTNNYDFVYYNHVIKPALVGLAGPWISGGIEFNWPQHHRPNTFGPVEYILKENEDGSKTVWVSEIDRMYGTKGMAGFTLYPDKSYLEIKGQLYNRTPEAQTFLWWANPAVAVNENTQSVFPPDVHAVLDHGKRDVSTFPIATGTYYKVDYSSGVDISRYKNIPVPTSYMAYKSDYDFVGGYDYGKNAGILHIANHHISPGKKQWTWGCGEFGKAWDRNLTDEDGPYIELMTGVFTDNQPDFTWLKPYEEKTFTQYFMPYKNIGLVKNATINLAINLEVKNNKANIAVYATSLFEEARVKLIGDNKVYIDSIATLSPRETFEREVELDNGESENNLKLIVFEHDGKELISYKKKEKLEEDNVIPEPAKAIDSPEKIKSMEELYLAGLHLEQYRHATYEPEDYYLEGLKREPEDFRINNAYGALLFRRGLFKESQEYFSKAIKSITRHNTNPYDCEAHYNLGLSLKYQGLYNEAYKTFYKATWSYNLQSAGFYFIAQMDCIKNDLNSALEHINKSIIMNFNNCKARNLKTAILRHLGKHKEAEKLAKETVKIDILDFASRNELYLLVKELGKTYEANVMINKLRSIMRDDHNNYISLSLDYGNAGLYEEAKDVLLRYIEYKEADDVYPMIYYYLGYYSFCEKDIENTMKYYNFAMKLSTDYCFPNTIDDLVVLKVAIENNPNDPKAYYYLGNLWYDKKQFNKAIECFEKSVLIDDSFPTVHRNLALGYYNKLKDSKRAKLSLEKAFKLNEKDARVFLELQQLYKKLNVKPKERLDEFEKHLNLVEIRDDLYIEYVTLMNLCGNNIKAKELLANRKFHPWEGGEGKVTKQYTISHIQIGKSFLAIGKYDDAIKELTLAMEYPENLGEGKLVGAQENDINYFLGCAFEGLGQSIEAKEYFTKASIGLEEPANAMFYNDQPPEMIFYQGLALLKLGQKDMANTKFNKLIAYGENHINDKVTIDYFAVSLPDFLIFHEDLDIRNIIHCKYLIALGNLGLNSFEKAYVELKEIIELDSSNQGALIQLDLLKSRMNDIKKNN